MLIRGDGDRKRPVYIRKRRLLKNWIQGSRMSGSDMPWNTAFRSLITKLHSYRSRYPDNQGIGKGYASQPLHRLIRDATARELERGNVGITSCTAYAGPSCKESARRNGCR